MGPGDTVLDEVFCNLAYLEVKAHAARWDRSGEVVAVTRADWFGPLDHELSGGGGAVWISVRNLLAGTEAGITGFVVSEEDLIEAIHWLGFEQDERLELRLWHSHNEVEGPSEIDLGFMREADHVVSGLIYHVPSDRTIAYDHSGIVSSNKAVL